MTEVQKLMQCFRGSYINTAMEVVLNTKTRTSFSVSDGMSRGDVLCKIFEWCSRDCAKGSFYADDKKNSLVRDSLCLHFSKYIGKVFDQNDFYWIYDRLGNAINHEATLNFIANGMDIQKMLEDTK